MQLESYSKVEAVIVCESGLRIGGSKDSLEIGALDNPIIRHPITGLPYIPGSSLKGKMRSLLEQKDGRYNTSTGKPCDCAECEICKLFGCGSPQRGKEITRLLFRDAPVTEESERILREAQEEKGLHFSEVKYETWIDRNTGKAGKGGLRNQERVPEGTSFRFEISVRLLKGDNKEQVKKKIREGIDLIQKDYLGGSGSRGYGKVRFENLTFDGKPF